MRCAGVGAKGGGASQYAGLGSRPAAAAAPPPPRRRPAAAPAVEGLMYLAPACTFWLALGSLALEFRPMLEAGAFGLMAARPAKFLAAAVMGFLVNSLAYIVIQVGKRGGGCGMVCGEGGHPGGVKKAGQLAGLRRQTGGVGGGGWGHSGGVGPGPSRQGRSSASAPSTTARPPTPPPHHTPPPAHRTSPTPPPPPRSRPPPSRSRCWAR